MASVASLVQKLSEVQDLLVALPDDAFAERGELIRRRDYLQTQAAAHAAGADHERPTEDLRSELVSLRLRRSRLGTVGSGDIGDEIPRIEGRMARIEAILDGRNLDLR